MAAVCNQMLLFCAMACWWWGPISAGGDTSNLNRLVRRSAVAGATLGTVGEMEKTKLTCFSTTDPQFVNVSHIFIEGEDVGFLWRGQPAHMSPCCNTSTPASSQCVPCLPDRNHVEAVRVVVCKDILKTILLGMESDVESLDINITAGDCPSFTKPADPEYKWNKMEVNRCRCASGYTGSLCETEHSTAGQLSCWEGLIIIIVAIIVQA